MKDGLDCIYFERPSITHCLRVHWHQHVPQLQCHRAHTWSGHLVPQNCTCDDCGNLWRVNQDCCPCTLRVKPRLRFFLSEKERSAGGSYFVLQLGDKITACWVWHIKRKIKAFDMVEGICIIFLPVEGGNLKRLQCQNLHEAASGCRF